MFFTFYYGNFQTYTKATNSVINRHVPIAQLQQLVNQLFIGIQSSTSRLWELYSTNNIVFSTNKLQGKKELEGVPVGSVVVHVYTDILALHKWQHTVHTLYCLLFKVNNVHRNHSMSIWSFFILLMSI